MSKLCYKLGETVKKYDLKDSVDKPRLAVRSGEGTKYLRLKQGTKSGEMAVKIGGQLYYVQTLDLGTAVLDENIKYKAFTQTAIFDRDYLANFSAICFTNTNKQIVAILCFCRTGTDRQGTFIDFSCFPTYFNPAATENPGGTIKISTIEYGCPGSIKISTLVNKLINDPWSPRIDGMESTIANRLKASNPRDNTVSTATSARTSMLKNSSYGKITYPNWLWGHGPLIYESGSIINSLNYSSYSRALFFPPPEVDGRKTTSTWEDSGGPYNGEGINSWGGWYGSDGRRHWLTGGYNRSSMVLGYHNGYPMIAYSTAKNVAQHCRYSFIEYPGTQPLGMKPFDFIKEWWTNVMEEHDATMSVTSACNTTLAIVPD